MASEHNNTAEYSVMDNEQEQDEEEERERQRLEEEQKRVIEEQRAARQKTQEKRNKAKNKGSKRRPKVELEDRDTLLQNVEQANAGSQSTSGAATAPPPRDDDDDDEAWSAKNSNVVSQLESARENASSEVNKLRQEQQHVQTNTEEGEEEEADETATQPQEDKETARRRILERKEDEVFEMLTELFESVQDKVDTQELFSRIKKASSSFRKGKSSSKQFYDDVDAVISTAMHAKYASSDTPSSKESKKILLRRYQFMEQLMPCLAETIPARMSKNGEEKKQELLETIREASRIHAEKRTALENRSDDKGNHRATPNNQEASQNARASEAILGKSVEKPSQSFPSSKHSSSENDHYSSVSASATQEQTSVASTGKTESTGKQSSPSHPDSNAGIEESFRTAEGHKASAQSRTDEVNPISKESDADKKKNVAQATMTASGNTGAANKPTGSISSKLQEARANAATETQHGNLPAKTAHSYLYDYPRTHVPYDQGILSISMYGTQIEKEPQTEKEYVSYILHCEWGTDDESQEGSSDNVKREWMIARRYREFDALQEEIHDILDDYVASRRYFGKDTSSVDPSKLPSLPKKTWSKGTDPKVIADRKLGLAKYIKELLEGFPLVLHMNPVDDFFMLSDRLRDVRRRKRDESRGLQHFGTRGQRQNVSLIEAIRRKLDRLGSSEDEIAVAPFWEQAVEVYGEYGAQVLAVSELPEDRPDIIPPSNILTQDQQESISRLIQCMEVQLDRAQKSGHKSTYLKNLIWQLLRCQAFVAYKYLENSIQAVTDPEQQGAGKDEATEQQAGASASASAASGNSESHSANALETLLDERDRLQSIVGQHEDELFAVNLAEQYSAE